MLYEVGRGQYLLMKLVPLLLVVESHDADLELAINCTFASRLRCRCRGNLVGNALGDGRADGGENSECLVSHGRGVSGIVAIVARGNTERR